MTASALYYNFDMAPACEKFLQDIADAQGEDGSVPDTVPKVWGGQNGDPMWSAAYPVILWETYLHTGDKGLLARHYDGIKKFIDHLQEQTKDLVLYHNTYGDWVSIEPTPKELISTGGFCWMTGMLADMAEALGRTEDAKTYRALKTSIAAAFNKAFYDPRTGIYGNGSQFSIAMPLALNIVPAQNKAQVLATLVDAVEVKHKGHLSTGFIGTPFLLDALVKHGRADLAYKIVSQPTYPGWGYMIENGATTVWELWHLATGNGMNSHNHPAFGFVSSWFYRTLAGLSPEAGNAGWAHFKVKPYVLGDLKWAKASIDTIRGKVASQWSLIDDGIELKVTVPMGSTAEVFLPKLGKQNCRVFSGNALVNKGQLRDAGDWISLHAGPGSHVFRLTSK
jgi:alpha-L-rhamnosidase